jgi:hypothetical protein
MQFFTRPFMQKWSHDREGRVMNEHDPHQTANIPSRRSGGLASRHRSALFRILSAAGAGGIIGLAVSGATVLLIGSTIGYMDYEFSGLCALFFGTVGAVVAAIVGVIVGLANTPVSKSARLLAASGCGGFCSGAVYCLILVPRATVPAMVLIWVGVVPVVAGLVTGAVGGLVGIGDRDAK